MIKGDLSTFFSETSDSGICVRCFSINSEFKPAVELYMCLFVLFSLVAFTQVTEYIFEFTNFVNFLN